MLVPPEGAEVSLGAFGLTANKYICQNCFLKEHQQIKEMPSSAIEILVWKEIQAFFNDHGPLSSALLSS